MMKQYIYKPIIFAVLAFIVALQAHAGLSAMDTLNECFDVKVINGNLSIALRSPRQGFVMRTDNNDMTCVILEYDKTYTLPNDIKNVDLVSREVSFDFSELETPDKSYRVTMRVADRGPQGGPGKYISKLIFKGNSVEEIKEDNNSKSSINGMDVGDSSSQSTVNKNAEDQHEDKIGNFKNYGFDRLKSNKGVLVLLVLLVFVIAVALYKWLRRKLIRRPGGPP